MPKMDGVELMAYLHENHPEICIIVLSGYNDYEYLNQSIKNKVTEYLLKPTDVSEFENVFRKLKEDMDKETEKKAELEMLKTNLEQHKKHEYTDFINMGIKGYIQESEKVSEIEHDYRVSFNNFYIIILEPDCEIRHEDAYIIRITITDALNKLIKAASFSMQPMLSFEDKLIVLFSPKEKRGGNKKQITDYITHVQKLILSNQGIRISAGVSLHGSSFNMLPKTYSQAVCAVNQRFFIKTKSIFFYNELNNLDYSHHFINFDYDNIFNCILACKEEEVAKEIDKVFSSFNDKVLPDYEYIERLSLGFLFQMTIWSSKHNVVFEHIMKNLNYEYKDFYKTMSPDKIKNLLKVITSKLIDYFRSQESFNNRENYLAYEIKALADNEYNKNHISLEYIADKVKKSVAYISKVFKNEFGCNLSDYITNKRIERGKELLRDASLRIYEISGSLGYANVSTFIKVFKKKCGISPTGYRGILKGKMNEKENDKAEH